jgi:hypothetical protein
MKTYLSQKHRLDAILASLAPSSNVIRIEGGLPPDALPRSEAPAKATPDPQPAPAKPSAE